MAKRRAKAVKRTGRRRSRSSFEPAFATAQESAEAIRTKQISATELIELTLRRVDRHNPAINAIIWESREQALARARQADEMLASRKTWGPLHGVPITIKESFAYRGSPNAWGLPALEKTASPRTAAAVEHLESAGAIVIGKTNVPVMLADWQSYNPTHGATNNPWDLARTAGGSTGGGAAALAAGLGCLALGSDLSGSIRVPAHFCGVYGHKPSLDLVNPAGHQPGPWDGSPGLPMDLAVVGPLARSAHDLALALSTIGGPSGDQTPGWRWRLPPPRRKRLASFRVGYILDDEVAPVTSDVRAVYERLIGELSRTGAKMKQGWPAGIEPRAHFNTFMFLLMAFVNFEKAADTHGRWLQETIKRLAIRAIWQKYFESHDVFLLPAGFSAAFPHDHTQPIEKRVIETVDGKQPYLNTAYWTYFATLAGLPATVAPVGQTDTGLPVGLQILAPMWEDGTSIEFAALLADLVGGFTAPKGVVR